MPILVLLGGIKLSMYPESGAKHKMIHLHANYGEFDAVYAIDGTKIEGQMPKAQNRKIKAWIRKNTNYIEREWEKGMRGDHIDRLPTGDE